MPKTYLVSLEGIAGVGKSTLGPKVALKLEELTGQKWEFIKEPVDEDATFQRLLADSLANPSCGDRRAALQSYITYIRTQQFKSLKSGVNYLTERSHFSSMAFIMQYLLQSEDTKAELLRIFEQTKAAVQDCPAFDMLVYLQAAPHVAYQHVMSRARDGEVYSVSDLVDSDAYHRAVLRQVTAKYKIPSLYVAPLSDGFFSANAVASLIYGNLITVR